MRRKTNVVNKKKSPTTKQIISLSLYKLLFKKEYDEITVKEICEEAGISRMSFYRYYDKKDDIFIDYCDERFEEFYELYILEQKQPLRELIISMFAFFKRYRRQIMILKKAHREQLLNAQFDSYARYVLFNSDVPEFVKHKDNHIAASFLSGGALNVLLYWLENDIDKTPEQMAESIFALFDKK